MEDRASIRVRATFLARAQHKLMRELVEQRERHNLSQDEVGDRMGMSQSAVSQFERYDSNPTLNSIRRYALAVGAVLEIDVIDDLIDPTDRAPKRAFVPVPHAQRRMDQESDSEWSKSPVQAAHA